MRPLFAALIALVLTAGSAYAAPVPRSVLTIDTAKGPVRFSVELASDPKSQAEGLMFRKHLAAHDGMLFDFHQPSLVTFWMKDTPLPLDMIFIRPNATVLRIQADAVPYSLTQIPSGGPIRAVLEINGGLAAALGIVPGDKVHHAIFIHSH